MNFNIADILQEDLRKIENFNDFDEKQDKHNLNTKIKSEFANQKEYLSKLNFQENTKDLQLQPQSLMVQSPELQTNFRKFLGKKVKEPPVVQPVVQAGEQLYNHIHAQQPEFQTGHSTSKAMKKFSQMRISQIKFLRNKLLDRQLQICENSVNLERIGVQLDQQNQFLDLELEVNVQRLQRLEGEDEFEVSKKIKKPDAISDQNSSLFSVPKRNTQHTVLFAEDLTAYCRYNVQDNKVKRDLMCCLQWFKHSMPRIQMKAFKHSVVSLAYTTRQHNQREHQTIEDILFHKDTQEKSSLYIMIKNLGSSPQRDLNEEQKFVQTVHFELMKPPMMHTEFLNLVSDLKALSIKLNKCLSIKKSDTQDNQNLFQQLKKDIVNAIELALFRSAGAPQQALFDEVCPECRQPMLLHFQQKLPCHPFHLRTTRLPSPSQPFVAKQPWYVRPSLDFLPFVEAEPKICQAQLNTMIFLNATTTQDPLLSSYLALLQMADRTNVIEQTKEASHKEQRRGNILNKYSEQVEKQGRSITYEKQERSIQVLEESIESYETDVLNPYTFQIQQQVRLLYNLVNQNKLKKILNVQRSVQKKLTIDFQVLQQTTHSCSGSKLDSLNPTLFDLKYKHNKKGFLNPVLPKFEPRASKHKEYTPEMVEYFKKHFESIHKRKDPFVQDEEKEEQSVYDEQGQEVMQDCAIEDFEELVSHLTSLASQQIWNFEHTCMKDLDIFNNENYNDDKPFIPIVDRPAILADLLEAEQHQQEAKLKQVLTFLEVYEHTQEAEVQRHLLQKIQDTMALRPAINFEIEYFKVSQEFETKILQEKTKLLKKLIVKQMDCEFEQNQYFNEKLFKELGIEKDQLLGKVEFARESKLDEYQDINQKLWSMMNVYDGQADSQSQIGDDPLTYSAKVWENPLQNESSQVNRYLNYERKCRHPHTLLEEKAVQNQALARESLSSKPARDELGAHRPPESAPVQFSSFTDLDNARMTDAPNENQDPKLAELNKYSEVYQGYPVWKQVRPQRSYSSVKLPSDLGVELIQVTEESNQVGVLDVYNSLQLVLKFEECWEKDLKNLPIGYNMQDDLNQIHAYTLSQLKEMSKSLDEQFESEKGKILKSEILKFDTATEILDSPECVKYAFRDIIEMSEPNIRENGMSLEKVRSCNLSDAELREQDATWALAKLCKPFTKWFSQPNLDVDENHDQQLQSFFGLTSSLSNRKIADYIQSAKLSWEKMNTSRNQYFTTIGEPEFKVERNSLQKFINYEVDRPNQFELQTLYCDLIRIRQGMLESLFEFYALQELQTQIQFDVYGVKDTNYEKPFLIKEDFFNGFEKWNDVYFKEFENGVPELKTVLSEQFTNIFDFLFEMLKKKNMQVSLVMGISHFEALYRTQLSENFALSIAVQQNSLLLNTLQQKVSECELIQKHHLIIPNSQINYKEFQTNTQQQMPQVVNQQLGHLKGVVFPKQKEWFQDRHSHKEQAGEFMCGIQTENFQDQNAYQKEDYQSLLKARIQQAFKLQDGYLDLRNLNLRLDAVKLQTALQSLSNTDYFNKIPEELKLFTTANYDFHQFDTYIALGPTAKYSLAVKSFAEPEVVYDDEPTDVAASAKLEMLRQPVIFANAVRDPVLESSSESQTLTNAEDLVVANMELNNLQNIPTHLDILRLDFQDEAVVKSQEQVKQVLAHKQNLSMIQELIQENQFKDIDKMHTNDSEDSKYMKRMSSIISVQETKKPKGANNLPNEAPVVLKDDIKNVFEDADIDLVDTPLAVVEGEADEPVQLTQDHIKRNPQRLANVEIQLTRGPQKGLARRRFEKFITLKPDPDQNLFSSNFQAIPPGEVSTVRYSEVPLNSGCQILEQLHLIRRLAELMWLRASFKSATSPLQNKLSLKKKMIDFTLEDILLQNLENKTDASVEKKKKNINKILSSQKDFKDNLVTYMSSLQINLEKLTGIERTRIATHQLKAAVTLEDYILRYSCLATYKTDLKEYSETSDSTDKARVYSKIRRSKQMRKILFGENDFLVRFNGISIFDSKLQQPLQTKTTGTLQQPKTLSILTDDSILDSDSLRVIYNRVPFNLKQLVNSSHEFNQEQGQYEQITHQSAALDAEQKMGIQEILKNLKQDIDKYMKTRNDIENKIRELAVPFFITPKYLDSGIRMLEICFEEFNMCELCCYFNSGGDFHYSLHKAASTYNELNKDMSIKQTECFNKFVRKRDLLSINMDEQDKEIFLTRLYDQILHLKINISIYDNICSANLIRCGQERIKEENEALSGRIFTQKDPNKHEFIVQPVQVQQPQAFKTNLTQVQNGIEKKMTQISLFLSRLKNRGTKVNSRQSGQSIVISISDLKESLEILIRELVSQGEMEIRDRRENDALTKRQLRRTIYTFERQATQLEDIIMQLRNSASRAILAKNSMNSNHKFFELSQTQKKLDTFQAKLNSVEELLIKKQKEDQEGKIERLKREKEKLKSNIHSYTNSLKGMLEATLATEAKAATALLLELTSQIEEDIAAIKNDTHYSRPNTIRAHSRGTPGQAGTSEFDAQRNISQDLYRTQEAEVERGMRYEERTDAHPSEPRKVQELFAIVKLNRILNIAKLGMQVKKQDDERLGMKNDIEKNNERQEQFLQKDNEIKKKDAELQAVQAGCSQLEAENDAQRSTIDTLKGGCVFLQKFKEDDQARLKELVRKAARQDKQDIINTKAMFEWLEKLQAESRRLQTERGQQEQALVAKRNRIKDLKLAVEAAERDIKLDEEKYRKRIVEINSVLVSKDVHEAQELAASQALNDGSLLSSVEIKENKVKKVTKNVSTNKLSMYEDETSRNRELKDRNLDLNKKYQIMRNLVMKKYKVEGEEFQHLLKIADQKFAKK